MKKIILLAVFVCGCHPKSVVLEVQVTTWVPTPTQVHATLRIEQRIEQ